MNVKNKHSLKNLSEDLQAKYTKKSQDEIVTEVIKTFPKLNFFKIKYKDNKVKGAKLNKSDYIVTVIDEFLKTVALNNCNICIKNGVIYLYNVHYWEQIDKAKFQNFLGRAAIKSGIELNTAKYYAFKEQLYNQFVSAAYLEPPKIEEGTTLINFLNGTFEITPQKQILRDFNSKDFLTYQLPIAYDREAKAPLFKKFLDEVLTDITKQKVLAEYLGYIFINPSVLKLEKVLILYGSGANGKSVVFEIVSALLGRQNISNYSLQSLTNDNGYYRAKIGDKRLNYASELNGKMETDVFKQMISGEPLEARLPYGEPFTLTQYAKLMFNCNTLPKDVEHTNAFFRRFLILHFDKTIAEKDQDKDLANKIINNELSGVFNWVLDGLQRVLKQKGFTYSKAIESMKEAYENESDSVKSFIDEYGYKSSLNRTTLVKTMYDQYRNYCFEDGFKSVNKTNFKKRLNHHKLYVKRAAAGYVVSAAI
ncbi:DNA primase family protein [Algibacter pectinivorans]|nr:phage/plasmid primase, P4 family [Algibacter pectinivorans]